MGKKAITIDEYSFVLLKTEISLATPPIPHKLWSATTYIAKEGSLRLTKLFHITFPKRFSIQSSQIQFVNFIPFMCMCV